MRFEEILHWNDGLFLQPHHLQQFQKNVLSYGHQNRKFYFPYPLGLIDFELDKEGLSSLRVILKCFSALMPNGLEVSMPGNTVLRPLDLTKITKEQVCEEIMIYLAVPLWSEFDANLSESDSHTSKRLYVAQERQVRDENTGDNEITIVRRKINARLITQFDDQTDLQVLPLLKLKVISDDGNDKTLVVDEKYVPPFLVMTKDCPLAGLVMGLLLEVQRCRDKIVNDLTVAQFKPESFSGMNAFNSMQLRVLNLYEARVSTLLSLQNLTPFDLYMELRSFLAELMGLHPLNDIKDIQSYNHFDCASQFLELVNDIRSLISSKGGASYIRLEFKPIDNNEYLYTDLSSDNILKANEYYLAISCKAEARDVISSLEKGDTFKLINPKAKRMRARGIKLVEMRYPPRFLPSLNDTLWFKLEIDETPRTWMDIHEEKGVLIDYAQDLFKDLEVSLFLTVVSDKLKAE